MVVVDAGEERSSPHREDLVRESRAPREVAASEEHGGFVRPDLRAQRQGRRRSVRPTGSWPHDARRPRPHLPQLGAAPGLTGGVGAGARGPSDHHIDASASLARAMTPSTATSFLSALSAILHGHRFDRGPRRRACGGRDGERHDGGDERDWSLHGSSSTWAADATSLASIPAVSSPKRPSRSLGLARCSASASRCSARSAAGPRTSALGTTAPPPGDGGTVRRVRGLLWRMRVYLD